jgi:hypothetical protein
LAERDDNQYSKMTADQLLAWRGVAARRKKGLTLLVDRSDGNERHIIIVLIRIGHYSTAGPPNSKELGLDLGVWPLELEH